ncbi:MAG: hypothetical protein A3F84_24965 [Candidatus Handelsmanbacteria bacterium RIFCSPLOWO2_12_FULL_64_10]|uniref:FHA domain-containing protein n=1 Tax=Handelsmanbacteria sp. (strain RIFCSPLOWO2_12_FULL_64_10) TaxID=1817868 RepID=A0A1F6CW90_HANXR|nr:MAG: hypothetical protein A3F84_24965 [Candidatus Handelsmanbacteria bacterium RIFCSPLOWO2_12_FULL_64_10]
MNTCEGCGHRNRSDALFCSRCGAGLPSTQVRQAILIQMSPPPHRAVQISGDALTIGRSETNDLVVEDDLASRHHLRLWRERDEFWAEDLSSTNGTYVNGRRIQRAPLQDADLLRVGSTIFKFQRHPQADALDTSPGIV